MPPPPHAAPDLDLDPYAFDAVVEGRWSPYAYAPTPVSPSDLRALFEAARRSPSSYNEQPWRFVVGTGGDEAYGHVLGTLAEANRAWARHAPVLGLTFAAASWARNGQPNPHALYDTGAAMAVLALAATARGLQLHQMAGFGRLAARDACAAPEGFEAVVAFALGYPAEAGEAPRDLPPDVAARDRLRRPRRPLHELVFGGAWGTPAAFAGGPGLESGI